jgi:hypothetical protein
MDTLLAAAPLPPPRRGFTALPNAILLNTCLSVPARLCYAVLQHFARRDPYAFPGQARLAAILGVTERTVRAYLRELVAAGLIRIEQRGLHQTNRYWLIGASDAPPLARADAPGGSDLDRKPAAANADADPTQIQDSELPQEEDARPPATHPPAPLEQHEIGMRPTPLGRTPPQLAPGAAHPEITRSEITQRLSQEEDGPPARASSPPPPCRSRIAERGSRNGLAGPGPCPVFSRAAHPPSAPRGAEPQDDDGPLSATHLMSTMFVLPLAAPTVANRSTTISLPRIPPTSAFRVPTSAFVWGAYRARLDPAAPPGLRTRIAADLAGAAARGVPLTLRGLAYALNESATARGPRWPYLFAVWQAHPNGEVGFQNAERGSRSSPGYQRPSSRPRFGAPSPLDPAKYAPGGKYGHLFAHQSVPAVT